MTAFETRVRQDTDEIYTRLDDEQSQRQRLDCPERLGGDRWMRSADCRRQTVISELLAADHRRQRQLTEALKLVKSLQTQMTEL
ncbi:hypothetical protein Tco_1511806 [Tanacetum coccineum]